MLPLLFVDLLHERRITFSYHHFELGLGHLQLRGWYMNALLGDKNRSSPSRNCFFFSAEFSLVTRIMFERLKFKVFKHFLASSQRSKLKISLKTRENTRSVRSLIIHEPYVNEQRIARGNIAQARTQIQYGGQGAGLDQKRL